VHNVTQTHDGIILHAYIMLHNYIMLRKYKWYNVTQIHSRTRRTYSADFIDVKGLAPHACWVRCV